MAKRTLTQLNGAKYPATPLFFHVCQILLNFSGVREQIPVVKAAHSHLKVAVLRPCSYQASMLANPELCLQGHRSLIKPQELEPLSNSACC